MDDRRRSVRHIACFPARVGGEGNDDNDGKLAIIRDLSVSGARLYSAHRSEPGDPLQLTLFIAGPEDARVMTARVVRCERRHEGALWPFELAVSFDDELRDCEEAIRLIALNQAKISQRG